MKKRELIKAFFKGGCIGITGIIFGYLIAMLIYNGITEQTIQQFIFFLIMFVYVGIFGVMAQLAIINQEEYINSKSINTNDQKKMRNNQIALQIKCFLVLLIISIVILVLSLINKITIGIALSVSMIIGLVLTLIAFEILKCKLKHNIQCINEKLSEKRKED